MSGGGSKELKPEQELLSIETYSGNVIGQINKDATDDEIQKFIQETTKNKSQRIKKKHNRKIENVQNIGAISLSKTRQSSN